MNINIYWDDKRVKVNEPMQHLFHNQIENWNFEIVIEVNQAKINGVTGF